MLLTVDIGTSSFKSALWDFDGNRLAFASVPLSAAVNDRYKHETDSAQWLRAFEDCCRKFAADDRKDLACVKAIVIGGNGPSLVPVTGKPAAGKEGLFLEAQPARLWLDRRAVQCQAEVSQAAGGFVDAGFFLPKILNIKNNEPDLYRRARYFLGCPEYLAYALTGQARTVFPSEGFDRWFWNGSVLETLQLDAAKFPAFIRPGDSYGAITSQAASLLGFTKETLILAGGPDFYAAILGAGVTEPEQACDRSGSSEGINVCTTTRINDERLMSYAHPVKPYWNLSGIISTAGKAVQWCRGLLGLSDFDEFFALAQESESGSGGLVFLPYLAGERAPVWDPSARASWSGISLSSGRREFANSVLEGIGFAIRDVIAVMEEAGAPVKELRVTGGLAGSGRLNQIKADITGKPVLEPELKEAELLGLAIIGFCSLGRFASFSDAASSLAGIKKRFEPDIKKAALYNRLFDEYKKLKNLSLQ